MHYYLVGYAALSVTSLVMYFITNLTWQYGSLRATRILHSRMLLNLVHCPMRFFDTTPIGRIINRFSSDMSVIDKVWFIKMHVYASGSDLRSPERPPSSFQKLPVTLPMLVRFLLLCVSAILVDSIVTPYFLIIIIPIVLVYYLIQKFFRATSRYYPLSFLKIINNFNFP